MKFLIATLAALAPSLAFAAPQKPLTIVAGQVRQIQATDTLSLPAATTANASVNLPHGTAPTSPTNGDVWTTTDGLQVRTNGTTLGNGTSGMVYYPTGLVMRSSGAAASNATIINAAIQKVGATNLGGSVQLPCGAIYVNATIDNNVPRVMVRGCGKERFHDAGSKAGTGTVIYPTVAMTVLKHRTPSVSTSSEFIGGGFADLAVDGNSVGTRLLEVTSVYGGYYDLYLANSVGSEAAYFTSYVSGTGLAEAADVQHAYVNLRVRQLDNSAAANANGVVIDGSSNANFSFNKDVNLDIQYENGIALVCKNADNNTINLRASRGSGGTGSLILGYGANATSTGCVGNTFGRVSGAGAIYLQGTADSGVTTAVNNSIESLDTGNGTPTPTSGTGSFWRYYDSMRDATTNSPQVHMLIADSGGAVAAALPNSSATSTLELVNGSSDALRFRDAGATISWGVSQSGNDLRIVQLAGTTGKLQLPTVRLASYTVAGLPTCAAGTKGALAYVTDATAPTYNGALTGGGAVAVPVFCNGSSWTAH